MNDPRPSVAIGHTRLHCGDVERSKSFYMSLGMRLCQSFPGVHVLELRGGTHLLLIQSPDGMMEILDTPFDLIVDDIEGYRNHLVGQGLQCSEVSFLELIGHYRLLVTDPDGRKVAIHSTHTEGRAV
jgi:catechol 2,3-dioxygenase-like lactoylglutathione lyase family enzyme